MNRTASKRATYLSIVLSVGCSPRVAGAPKGGTAGAEAPAVTLVKAMETAGCKAMLAKPWFKYTCGQKLTLLAIVAHESDANPVVTEADAKAYLTQDGYRGFKSVAQRMAEETSGLVQLDFLVTSVTLPKSATAYQGKGAAFVQDAVDAMYATKMEFGALSKTPEGSLYPFLVLDSGAFINPNQMGFYAHGNDKWAGVYSFSYLQKGQEVGVILHELGHALFGFGEFYSTKGDGTGSWDIMAHGFDADYNPYVRSCRGWITTYELEGVPIGTVIDLPADGSVALRYRTTSRPAEYFMVTAIQKRGPGGAGWTSAQVQGEGLLVWHVDEAMEYQMPDDTPKAHYQVALVQADGKRDIELGKNIGDATDPFRAGHVDAFGSTTTPAATWWDGTPSGLEISSISAPAPRMTFVVGPKGTAPSGAPVLLGTPPRCSP